MHRPIQAVMHHGSDPTMNQQNPSASGKGTGSRRAARLLRTRPTTPEAHRAYALEVASQGFALLAHAVNACDNPETPYRFADAERERFMSLCARLYSLVERGRIETRAAALAQDDVDFQRFVNRSLAAITDGTGQAADDVG
jgi:hypothetical protein